jgi:hypothetical protein
VLAKFCVDQSEKWYRQVGKVQIAINGLVQRSIGMTPLKLTLVVEIRRVSLAPLKEAIAEEYVNWYESQREEDQELLKPKKNNEGLSTNIGRSQNILKCIRYIL